MTGKSLHLSSTGSLLKLAFLRLVIDLSWFEMASKSVARQMVCYLIGISR